MKLRTRLLLTLGLTLVLLWGVAAAWLMQDLHREVEKTLDQRLAQSARMVAGLMEQLPPDTWTTARRNFSIPATQGLACQVIAPGGKVIARTHVELNQLLSSDRPGYAYRDMDGATWRVFTLRRSGLTITTADRLGERNRLLRDVITVAAVPFVVALLGSLVAIWLGVLRGLRPLARLQEGLRRRNPEDLAPLPVQGLPGELHPLIQAFNDLLARIRRTIEREQRFTDDAAHELRTPLTGIKTHLQVARRLEGDAVQQALSQAELGVGRLGSTLDQLLMLARVEGRAGFGAETASSLAEVMALALADCGGAPERFELPATWPSVRLALPRELAVTAMRNLIVNALTHGPGDRPVVLEASCSDQHWITVTVRDAGSGPPQEALAHLAERFWRAGKQQGSGLGLAIVAAIAQRAGGELSFATPAQGGFEARLILPVE